MLLTIDIGNTNIGMAVFREEQLLRYWKIRSESQKTCDEYAISLLNLLSLAGLKKEEIQGAIFSSVVPPLTPVFEKLGKDFFGIRPYIVGPGLKTGMPILYENPQEVGADRIAASVAGFERCSAACIVVDFGTATTFDAVSSKGEYLGGAIAPGIRIAAEALYSRTAKLPHVQICKPKGIIGKTTVSSIQSGLYFGYIGLVTNIINEMKGSMGNDCRVISTGGGELFHEVDVIDEYVPHLVMEGLRILYERNVGPGGSGRSGSIRG